MIKAAHLWAVGYDDTERADQVRAEVTKLGERRSLIVLDTAVAVRYADGTVALDGEPLVSAPKLGRHTLASFFAGLALGAPPLTARAVGALVRSTGSDASPKRNDQDANSKNANSKNQSLEFDSWNLVFPHSGAIDDEFISQVAALMRPGTSTLFVLDQEGEMSAILQGIRGLGGHCAQKQRRSRARPADSVHAGRRGGRKRPRRAIVRPSSLPDDKRGLQFRLAVHA
jgi:uncharacterized membrane protein